MDNQNPKRKTLEEVLKLISQDYATSDEVAKITSDIAKQVLNLKQELGLSSVKLNSALGKLLDDHKTLQKSSGYSVAFLRKELESLSKAISNLKLQHGKDGKDGMDAKPVDTAELALEASKMAVAECKAMMPGMMPTETGDTIITKINDSENEQISKDKVEGLGELERKADFALSRPIMMGGGGQVLDVKAGTNVTVDKRGGIYTINSSGGGGGVDTVVGGTGITVDDSDPANPIVNNDNPTPYTLPTASATTKGGVKIGARLTMTGEVLSADVQAGGGDVLGPATNSDSYIPQWDGVNSKTLKNGVATSTFEPAKGADDNYVTDAEKTVIGNTSGTNTGDNATNSQYSGLAASKQDTLISGTNLKTVAGTSLLGSGDLGQIASSYINLPVDGGSPTLDTLTEDFTTRGSSGVSDGTITYVTVGTAANKVSVAAGQGYIRTTNDQQGDLKMMSWSAAADLATLAAPAAGLETTIFVGIEYSGGSTTAVTKTAITDFNWYTNFPLARVAYDGTTLHIINAYAHSEDTANHTRQYLRKVFGFNRENAPEGTGGFELGVTLRELSMTGGNLWLEFNKYVAGAVTLGTAFDLSYKQAGGGFVTGSGTNFPNTQYDNGSGTLQDLTANRYGTLWVYYCISEGNLHIMYGAVNTTSVAAAQADTAPTTPDHLAYGGKLIGRIIFQKSGATATLVESAWTNVFNASAVGDHNLLTSLQGGTAGEYYHLTSAQNTVVGNTSGTNTGDQDLSGLVPYTGATANVDLGAYNLHATNVSGGLTSTLSQFGTLTLTATSTYIQELYGAAGSTVVLPDVTTLTIGQSFYILNNTGGFLITVKTSGDNTLLILSGLTRAIVTYYANNGSGVSSWNTTYFGHAITSGKKLTVTDDASVTGTNTGDSATNTTSNTYADGKVADAINDGTTTIAPSQNAVFDALALKVDKSTYDAHTVLYATTDNTPVALTVGEQTLVGRATGGNISAIAIDSDLSSVSANDDTVPSAKATKAMGDLKLPLAGGTMTGDITLAESKQIILIVPTTDGGCSGPSTSAFVSGYTSSAIGDLVYLDVNAKWQKVDADAIATTAGMLGIALAVAATDAALLVALPGSFVYSTAFPTLTVGGTCYAGETAGAIQQTIPTGASGVIREIGYAIHADKIYFMPTPTSQEVVA